MNKQELIDALAGSADLTKKAAGDVLEALGVIVATSLKGGGEVTLPNIGTLSVKDRAARMGRNPLTGEAVPIAAKKAPAFKAAKKLKDAVNA